MVAGAGGDGLRPEEGVVAGAGGEPNYRWVILTASFTSIFFATAIRNSFQVSFVPIVEELGWERGSLALSASIFMLVFGVTQPWVGRMSDRYGPRRIIGLGAFLVGWSFILLSRTHHLGVFYLVYGLVAGLGYGAMAYTPNNALIGRWFTRNKGLALSIADNGSSLGFLVLAPLWVVVLTGHHWRSAYLVAGLGMLLVVLPVIWALVRDDPPPSGPLTAGRRPGAAAAAAPLRSAVATSTFWYLAAGFFVCGFSMGIIDTHLVPHLADLGVGSGTIARTLVVLGAAELVGAVAIGWVSDRVDRRIPLAVVYLLRGVALVILAGAAQPWALYLFAALFGFNFLASLPIVFALVDDLYGRAAVGAVFGTVFLAHQIGGAVSSFAGGLVRDSTGHYGLVIWTGAALLALAAAVSLRVPGERRVGSEARLAAVAAEGG